MKYKVTLNNRVYEVEVEAGQAMLLDEYEAIRLVDLEQKTHEQCGKMEGHSGGMKKLHNTVLQAVIGQLGVIKSNLEGLLPTEDQQGHECITDAIGSVKDAIGDIEEAMD